MPPIVTLELGVCATLWGAARCVLTDAQLSTCREPLSKAFPALSTSTLKQADEQTLTALMAIHQLRQGSSLPTEATWGVLACPQRPGRKRLTETLTKFRTQGAWSTSPHVIPHTLLHSISGLISQALGTHGPNLGVGGVPGAEDQVLTAATAWLGGNDAQGVWLIWVQPRSGDGCEARVALVERTTATTGEPFWPTFERTCSEAQP